MRSISGECTNKRLRFALASGGVVLITATTSLFLRVIDIGDGEAYAGIGANHVTRQPDFGCIAIVVFQQHRIDVLDRIAGQRDISSPCP